MDGEDNGANHTYSLSFLGNSVIHLVVTAVLEEYRPLSRPGDLAVSRSDGCFIMKAEE
jgi:hypothetical protein